MGARILIFLYSSGLLLLLVFVIWKSSNYRKTASTSLLPHTQGESLQSTSATPLPTPFSPPPHWRSHSSTIQGITLSYPNTAEGIEDNSGILITRNDTQSMRYQLHFQTITYNESNFSDFFTNQLVRSAENNTISSPSSTILDSRIGGSYTILKPKHVELRYFPHTTGTALEIRLTPPASESRDEIEIENFLKTLHFLPTKTPLLIP